MQFAVTRWNKSTPPVESELDELFFKEGLFPYAWSNSPGDTYAPHVHDYDKVIVVVRGSIKWTLPETNESFDTHSGDRIELSRGTWHAAEVFLYLLEMKHP